MKSLTIKDEKLKNWNLNQFLNSWKQGIINEPIVLAEESPDQRRAVLYKDIFEYAMGGYKGHLVLLDGPDNPKVALEIKGMCPNHVQGFRHFAGKYLVAICCEDRTNKWASYPILIIDLDLSKFTFLDNPHGYAFRVEVPDPDTLRTIRVNYEGSFYDSKLSGFDGRTYKVSQLSWLPIGDIEQAHRFFHEKYESP